jgi:spore germination protein
MYKFRRLLSVAIKTFVIMNMAGCWSSNEIDKQSVYVGMSLDTSEQRETGRRQIASTLQILTPNAGGTGARNQSRSNAKPYLNIEETGDSLFEMIRNVSIKTDRPPIGHHLKVIVIGGDLAREQSLESLLDFFFRDNDIRPSTLVFMSKGTASDVFKSNKADEIPAFLMEGIADNRYRTSKILPRVSLGKLKGAMRSDSSFLLQNVAFEDGEMKFSCGSVIQGQTKKLVGFLNEDELRGVVWISGEGKGGLIKSYDPETHRQVTYEIKSMKSKIRSTVDGKDISFRVDIESEGRLIESWVSSQDVSKKEFLDRQRDSFREVVKKLVERSLQKTQKKFGTDIAGFGERLRIEHPRLWEQVKENWDQTFKEVPVQFRVRLKIEDYGSIGSS